MVSPAERDPSGGFLFRRFLFRQGRAVVRNPLPAQVARRRPPPLIGLHLLEAVPDEVIRAFADPQDEDGDGISGRTREVEGRIARFGWKSRFVRVEDAVAAALAGEMGLTTAQFPASAFAQSPTGPPEVDSETLAQLVVEVMTMSRAPASAPDDTRGAALFEEMGCAACHRPQLPLVPTEMGRLRVANAYTDLLLHDMGPTLSDGFDEEDVRGSEFRTAPLWRAGTAGPPYLHDGRAKTLDEAIRLHGGEAARSARAYEELSPSEQRRLLAFVRSR